MKGTIGVLLGMVGIGGPLARLGCIGRNSEGQVISVSGFKKKVTDAKLVRLKGLTELQSLDLSETKITDAGLVHLKGLTNLQDFHLDDTQITDAGLVHLKGMSSLTRLNLWKTQVTDAGVAELQKALPNCTIYK